MHIKYVVLDSAESHRKDTLMMAAIRKTWHVVKHRAPVSPIVERVIMHALAGVVLAIMVAVFLTVIHTEARTHVTGRKWYVTVINGESVDNYALFVRGRWEPVDRLTYFRCNVRDEFPGCAR